MNITAIKAVYIMTRIPSHTMQCFATTRALMTAQSRYPKSARRHLGKLAISLAVFEKTLHKPQ